MQDPLNFALGRMLSATNLVGGSGMFGGRAVLETTGNSMATMLANGNGSLQLTMAGGGDLSALLVDLSGLQFGNALLSALGVRIATSRVLRGVFRTPGRRAADAGVAAGHHQRHHQRQWHDQPTHGEPGLPNQNRSQALYDWLTGRADFHYRLV